MFRVTTRDGGSLTFNNPNNAISVFVAICEDRNLSFEGIPFLNDNGVLVGIITEHDLVDVGVVPKV